LWFSRLFFYLLSDLNLKSKSSCIDLPTNYFKKTAHLEKIGFSKNLEDIKINEKIKNKQYKVFNLLRIFNSLNYPKRVNSNNCLVFENTNLWWTADSDSFFPVKINDKSLNNLSPIDFIVKNCLKNYPKECKMGGNYTTS
jgi:hypothetical protein